MQELTLNGVPYVIYTDEDGFKMTPRANYYAYMQNARAIMDLHIFPTIQSIIDYFKTYYKYNIQGV